MQTDNISRHVIDFKENFFLAMLLWRIEAKAQQTDFLHYLFASAWWCRSEKLLVASVASLW